jgi:hypothetical protein
MRQLEDYRYLGDPQQRSGEWWEHLKYIRLWPSPSAPFLTLGGEVRVRYEWIDNTDFGSGPQDNGGYLLTRYLPYASLTIPGLPGGWDFLAFGQLVIASNDYDQRGAGPIDEDGIDMLQAFARVRFPLGDGQLSVQGGRQVISFGSERVIGTRYGPNVPLSFDGGIIEWKDTRWDIHVFFLQPVQVAPDPLDNESSGNQQFWGVYSTRRLDNVLSTGFSTGLDAYYLGYYDNDAVYNSGSGTELRHTLGVRLYGDKAIGPGTVDWNYEGIVQFGRFDSNLGTGSIFAWSVGTESGYTFDAPWKPRASLRANIVSGDNDASSPNLQTFNPMFPKGKYFGELTPIGPYNLINLLGAIGLRFTDSLTLTLQGGPYWRYSTQDAVYGVGGNIVRASDGSSNARFIGTQFECVAEWSPRRELSFLVSYSQFVPGTFIEETGPAETIHFVAVEAVFQF